MNSDEMRGGIIPGLIAGYIFFAYAGQEIQDFTLAFGWQVLASVLIGAFYTGLFMQYVHMGSTIPDVLVGGTIYGLFWWIVGWNIILPLLNGNAVLQLHIGPSFYGHIIFGHTLAFLIVLRDAAMGMFWGDYSNKDHTGLPRLKHPAGYIYHASSDSRPGQVKIGRTNNPDRRLGELKREFGADTRFKNVKMSENAPRDEQRLHRRLSTLRRVPRII